MRMEAEEELRLVRAMGAPWMDKDDSRAYLEALREAAYGHQPKQRPRYVSPATAALAMGIPVVKG